MALFKKRGKPTYTQLQQPKFDSWPVPDINVLRRDGQMIGLIVKSIQERVAQIGNDGSHLSETLGDLQERLIEAFTRNRPSHQQAIRPHVQTACHMGYLTGVMENDGGVARTGYAENHYWTALAMLATQVSDDFGLEATYSLVAAYYVARVGQPAIDSSVATAAAWAGGQSFDSHAT
jgi:hypothetical protein